VRPPWIRRPFPDDQPDPDAEPNREPTLVGRTLRGGLRVLEQLGETNEGLLYRAEYVTGLEVMLVLLRAGTDRDGLSQASGRLARLLQQLRRATEIDHPNVVAVRGVDETAEGLAYAVLEQLRGELLADILRERQGFPTAEAVHLILQAAAGLQAAHAAGLVHGNLSPATFLVTRTADGRPLVKLICLGLALQDTPEQATDAAVGAEYASPERRAGHTPDERSDVFSLGAVLHHLLTGVPLGGASDPGSLPEVVRTVVARALAPAPADRFQSVAEFAATLEHAVAIAPRRRASTPLPWERALQSPVDEAFEPSVLLVPSSVDHHRRTLALGVAAAALVLLAVGLWVVGRSSRATHGTTRPLPETSARAPVTAAVPDRALPESAIGSSTLAASGAQESAQRKAESGPLAALRIAAAAGQPIEGSWRLLAHRVGQEILRPPRAEGFFSVRDGIILLQLRRMIGDTVFEFYGSGGYSGSADQFSYGYDRMVWVTRRPSGVTAHDTIPFEGRRAFLARQTSAGVRYETDGARYVWEVLGDTLIYSEQGSWLRRWIRVRPTSSGQ